MSKYNGERKKKRKKEKEGGVGEGREEKKGGKEGKDYLPCDCPIKN